MMYISTYFLLIKHLTSAWSKRHHQQVNSLHTQPCYIYLIAFTKVNQDKQHLNENLISQTNLGLGFVCIG